MTLMFLFFYTLATCFYGQDTVNLVQGGQRSIENLVVGDRIWSLSPDGQTLIPDEIIMMMDNGPNQSGTG